MRLQGRGFNPALTGRASVIQNLGQAAAVGWWRWLGWTPLVRISYVVGHLGMLLAAVLFQIRNKRERSAIERPLSSRTSAKSQLRSGVSALPSARDAPTTVAVDDATVPAARSRRRACPTSTNLCANQKRSMASRTRKRSRNESRICTDWSDGTTENSVQIRFILSKSVQIRGCVSCYCASAIEVTATVVPVTSPLTFTFLPAKGSIFLVSPFKVYTLSPTTRA
jgi:hypothetical protein